MNSFQMALLRRQGKSNKEIAEEAGVTEDEVARRLREYARHVASAHSPSAFGMKNKENRR